jgi:hypothetical protein
MFREDLFELSGLEQEGVLAAADETDHFGLLFLLWLHSLELN